jgi:hypothetical protein
LPPVIGKLATPLVEIFALPVGAGVSLSVVSAFTKPLSRLTAVERPVSWSICAAGFGWLELWLEEPELLLPELELSLPQAAAPIAMAAQVAMAAGLASLMSDPLRR